MIDSSPTVMLRAFKGSPLSVLIGMIIAKKQGMIHVGERWLITETDWSQNKVRDGLSCLERVGVVARSTRVEGWYLTDGAYQLPLVILLLGSDEQPGLLDFGTKAGESQNLTLAATTTTTLRVEHNSLREVAVVEASRESESDSRGTDEEILTPAEVEENLKALREAGLWGRKAEELAKIYRLTPDYIRAHAAQVAREGKEPWVLMCRLRDGDLLPEEVAERVKRSESKYLVGEFAEFINH
jgi:hypothetical protein